MRAEVEARHREEIEQLEAKFLASSQERNVLEKRLNEAITKLSRADDSQLPNDLNAPDQEKMKLK